MILIGQLYDTDPSLSVVPQQNAAKEAVFFRWLFACRGNGSFMEITVAPCAPTGQTLRVAHLEDYVQCHRKMRREGVEKRFIPMADGVKLDVETQIKSCWTTERAVSHGLGLKTKQKWWPESGEPRSADVSDQSWMELTGSCPTHRSTIIDFPIQIHGVV